MKTPQKHVATVKRGGMSALADLKKSIKTHDLYMDAVFKYQSVLAEIDRFNKASGKFNDAQRELWVPPIMSCIGLHPYGGAMTMPTEGLIQSLIMKREQK